MRKNKLMIFACAALISLCSCQTMTPKPTGLQANGAVYNTQGDLIYTPTASVTPDKGPANVTVHKTGEREDIQTHQHTDPYGTTNTRRTATSRMKFVDSTGKVTTVTRQDTDESRTLNMGKQWGQATLEQTAETGEDVFRGTIQHTGREIFIKLAGEITKAVRGGHD